MNTQTKPRTTAPLPLHLLHRAARAYPEALRIARSMELDAAALEPIRRYLISREGQPPARTSAAERAFLKYMTLVSCANESIAPSEEADTFWHAFILHTVLYDAWCRKHFGRFVHHVPTPSGVHPSEHALHAQNEMGRFFFGCRTIYATRNCSNSHGCVGCTSPGGCGHNCTQH